ncbi:hypothetical protein GUB85_25385 [Escherichia coli]|nr:hypothetical protein [Escherichia coli]NAJ54056.1 hypothetical protein [Escherichia coli]
MITITKERLLTIKQWRETYGPGSNVVLPAEEAEELARIALASLEAEPVAKIIAHYPLGIDVGKQKFVQAIGELPDFGGHLFAAPPAAVVPDDGREKFEALVRFHAGDKNHETLLLRANEGMNYQDPNVDLAWIFWKSSREHI